MGSALARQQGHWLHLWDFLPWCPHFSHHFPTIYPVGSSQQSQEVRGARIPFPLYKRVAAPWDLVPDPPVIPYLTLASQFPTLPVTC